jgi:hypothetical protein
MAITTKRRAEKATTAELKAELARIVEGGSAPEQQRYLDILDAGLYFGSAYDPERALLRRLCRTLIIKR